jgi:hypothetical protein
MILSKQALFSEDQAITATANSTNTLDLLAHGSLVGASAALPRKFDPIQDVPLLIQVTADFATLTSLTVSVIQSDAENLGTPDTLVSSAAIPAADLVAGYVFPILRLPPNITKQYIGLTYTVAGSNATAGTITAGIAHNQSNV